MAYFAKPAGSSSEGYDSTASGALWRMRLPLGGTRRLALVDGSNLKVVSGNTNAIPQDRLNELSDNGKIRTFEVYGLGIGGSWIMACSSDGTMQFQIQAWVEDAVKLQKELHAKSSLQQNIGFSMQACKFVLKQMEIKAPNYDKYRGQPSYEKGTSKPDALDICLYEKSRPEVDMQKSENPNITQLDIMRISAEQARRNKCGNCGENSNLAYTFLYDLGIRPIDSIAHSHDHNFVVIGRRDGDPNNVTGWGPDAVICDPWMQGLFFGNTAKGSYPASQLEAVQRIKSRGLKMQVIHRAV